MRIEKNIKIRNAITAFLRGIRVKNFICIK